MIKNHFWASVSWENEKTFITRRDFKMEEELNKYKSARIVLWRDEGTLDTRP